MTSFGRLAVTAALAGVLYVLLIITYFNARDLLEFVQVNIARLQICHHLERLTHGSLTSTAAGKRRLHGRSVLLVLTGGVQSVRTGPFSFEGRCQIWTCFLSKLRRLKSFILI